MRCDAFVFEADWAAHRGRYSILNCRIRISTRVGEDTDALQAWLMVAWVLLRSVFNAFWPPKGGRREMRFSDAELRSESAKYSVAIRRLLKAMP